ncbi:uncharacterized protein V1516DRAFT_671885 [Lipomyces oligophaga]|uniref:uncharacterized protein n=1 Tax=Lipomyces oligophaga TaxID=45792 RepID=UPI0034CF9FCD
MAGNLLQEAHHQASDGDTAILSGRPEDAITHYLSAASLFESVKSTTKDEEALRMLDILNKRYSTTAAKLKKNLELNPDMFKSLVGSGNESNLNCPSADNGILGTSYSTVSVESVNQLAVNLSNARLPRTSTPLAAAAAAGSSSSTTAVAATATGVMRESSIRQVTTDDLFNKFFASFEGSMNKVQHSLSKTTTAFDAMRRQSRALLLSQHSMMLAQQSSQPISSGDTLLNPGMEASYFMVAPTSATANPTDHASSGLGPLVNDVSRCLESHKTVLQAQKDNLRKGIKKLRNEVRSHEQRRIRELELEIDKISARNQVLTIENVRLKTRWDDLKRKAMKRRGGIGATDGEPLSTLSEVKKEDDDDDERDGEGSSGAS